jgi:hypothetical protein
MPSTSSTIPTLPCRQRTSQVAVLEPSARSQLRQPAPMAPSRELASGAVLFRSSAKSTSDLFHQKHSSGRLRPFRFLFSPAQDTLAQSRLIFSQHWDTPHQGTPNSLFTYFISTPTPSDDRILGSTKLRRVSYSTRYRRRVQIGNRQADSRANFSSVTPNHPLRLMGTFRPSQSTYVQPTPDPRRAEASAV